MIRKDFHGWLVTAPHAIIDGKRRFRAEKRLGTKEVRVKVFDVDKWEALEQRLNEAKLYSPEEREAVVWQLYKHYKENGEPDNSITRRIRDKTSIPLSTVQSLIRAAQERHLFTGKQSDVIQTAKYRDLNKTEKLQETAPEAREEVL